MLSNIKKRCALFAALGILGLPLRVRVDGAARRHHTRRHSGSAPGQEPRATRLPAHLASTALPPGLLAEDESPQPGSARRLSGSSNGGRLVPALPALPGLNTGGLLSSGPGTQVAGMAGAQVAMFQTPQGVGTGQSLVQILAQRRIDLAEQLRQDQVAEEQATVLLSDSRSRLKQVDVDLARSLVRLAAAKGRLEADRGTLKLRLRQVYEQGSVGILQALLDSRNVPDFLNRREYASRVVHRDLAIVGQVHQDQDEIASESRLLEMERSERTERMQKIEGEADRLKQVIAHRTALLLSTQQEIEAARQTMLEQQAASSNVESMLSRLQKAPFLTVQEARGRRLNYKLHWGGLLVRPAEGQVTSPFGYRYHPLLHLYKLHTGVDIATEWGAPVRASAGGVVVQAGWLGAYGNGIVIDHGDGLATLYGHLSRMEVNTGQAVAQSQEIGRTGTTGLSTGPHLHFEVRKYGTPIAPF